MRFLHTADIHLGAEPDAGKVYSQSRGREIWNSFSEIIEVCQEQSVDLLLIAGDLFHRQPLMRELKEVNYLFSKIPETRVVLIAGNHDYLKRDSYCLTFPWGGNVRPLYSGNLERAEFPEIQTCVYGLSYYSKEITEPLYDSARAERRQPIEILLAHGGDEKHIPLQKSTLMESGFSYAALGHIHKPQTLIPNMAAYAGALEPIDKNDTGRHGYILGEITPGKTAVRFVESACREYKHVNLNINARTTDRQLLELIKSAVEELGLQHIYKITVKGFRDPDIHYDLDYIDPFGNIIESVDETMPAYDFEKLMLQNKDNLLGKYIRSLIESKEGSIEYQALYEGVQALMETKGDNS